MSDIKDYRNKELKAYIIANIGLMLLLASDLNIVYEQMNNIPKNVLLIIVNSAIIATAFYCFVFIADCLLTSELKDILVFFLPTKYKPGGRVFSTITAKQADDRFTLEECRERYTHICNGIAQLTGKKKYQFANSQWYKMYSKHKNDPMILSSNRDYLLCRDMYISTIVILTIYIIMCAIFAIISWEIRGLLYLIIMGFALNIATRNKANKLTRNVIALDIYEARHS